ncbi:MAG: hypothetical protein P8X70_00570 [Nanoarchaeota archaeon]|jgi:hypothetical protein
MQEIIRLIVGILVLALGFPIGNLLAHATKEELRYGKKWFRIIIFLCLIFGTGGLIFRKDVFMFSFFFIAIITSRSLKKINK